MSAKTLFGQSFQMRDAAHPVVHFGCLIRRAGDLTIYRGTYAPSAIRACKIVRPITRRPSRIESRRGPRPSLFRLNVIKFLRLPLDVSEAALRDVLKQCSSNLFASYLARLERAHEESGAPIEVP
jgi:hypothetical protein